jgi:hypothetical protein
MLNFRSYLYEVFDKTYPYTLKVTDQEWSDAIDDMMNAEYMGKFKTKDNGNIEVKITNYAVLYDDPNKPWHIDFFKNGGLDATQEGDEFAIISTVLHVIKDFIKKENPKAIIFEAGKSGRGQRNTETRSKLYKTLVKKFARTVGYTYSVKDEHKATYFTLNKK